MIADEVARKVCGEFEIKWRVAVLPHPVCHKIEKLPLVEGEKVVGLITAKDLAQESDHPNAAKDKRGRLRVGAAVSTHPEDRERRAHARHTRGGLARSAP